MDLDAAVLSHPQHIFHLSGFLATATYTLPALLYAHPAGFTLIAAEEFADAAPLDDAGATLRTYQPKGEALLCALNVLRDILKAKPPKAGRLGVDFANLGAETCRALATQFDLVDIEDDLIRCEMRHDANAIAAIRRNAVLNDSGFAAARSAIRPGVTELAVYAEIQRQMLPGANYPFFLAGCLVSGERAAHNPAGQPNSTLLVSGDAFLIDLFPSIHGYTADTTRTFTVGRASAIQKELHQLLEHSLTTISQNLRPGISYADLSSLAWQIQQQKQSDLNRRGVAGRFSIHGHGIGLSNLALPLIVPTDAPSHHPEEVLEVGQVYAWEPGIYAPGTAGMRLEENYLITPYGCEGLSTFPIELAECCG